MIFSLQKDTHSLLICETIHQWAESGLNLTHKHACLMLLTDLARPLHARSLTAGEIPSSLIDLWGALWCLWHKNTPISKVWSIVKCETRKISVTRRVVQAPLIMLNKPHHVYFWWNIFYINVDSMKNKQRVNNDKLLQCFR